MRKKIDSSESRYSLRGADENRERNKNILLGDEKYIYFSNTDRRDRRVDLNSLRTLLRDLRVCPYKHKKGQRRGSLLGNIYWQTVMRGRDKKKGKGTKKIHSQIQTLKIETAYPSGSLEPLYRAQRETKVKFLHSESDGQM